MLPLLRAVPKPRQRVSASSFSLLPPPRPPVGCSAALWPARRFSSSQAAAGKNPHQKGYGWAVAQRLANKLGRGVPKARQDNVAGQASTVAVSLLLACSAAGAAYLALTEQGSMLVKDVWGRLHELGLVKEVTDPIRDKLLPDFPEFPPGHQAPRTLVLDLEDTLCHLEWDRTYGWRAAKRPGLDTFLVRMAQAGYEVVLFTSGLHVFLEPWAYSMDPHGCISHRLYRDSTTFTKNGERVKDLSRLNRDLRGVVVIDDDPKEVQWHPQNLIAVKPFTDPRDSADLTLLQLIPVLEDFVMRDVSDVRVELQRLRDLGQGDAIKGFWLEQEQRAEKARSMEHRGIGGAIRHGGLGVLKAAPVRGQQQHKQL